MHYFESVSDLVGNTPLLKLSGFLDDPSAMGSVFAKLEYFNPAGSVKDRLAKTLIEDAEEKGLLSKDSILIEPTSGNTGIGLAAIAAAKGYRVMITMPETMSVERQKLMKAYGAQVVLTDGALGMAGAIDKAQALAKEIPNSFLPGQFTNPVNALAHYRTTGPEIWRDLEGMVDVLVAGVGTGGTISGTGKFLKEKNPNIKVIAVEPADSPVLSKGTKGPHKIQGIGAGFIPDTLDTKIYDEVFTVTSEEAFSAGRKLAAAEGILVGISSGAALSAALQIAMRPAFHRSNIVVILPDTGERYLSSEDYFL